MKKPLSIAFLGGDERQKYAAEKLSKYYDEILIWGLGCPWNGMKACEAAIGAVGQSDIIVLPIRVTADGKNLYCPLQKETRLDLLELSHMLPSNTIVLGGDLPCEFRKNLEMEKVRYINYFEREELQIKNARLTAEGAIALAITEMPVSVLYAKIGILGYGRIGKLLTDQLIHMGADVTVFARKAYDRATAQMHGASVASFYQNVEQILSMNFDLIYNTVPQTILNDDILSQMKQNCIVIDLASAPGGVDFHSAERHGIKAIWATGLPGKTAPKSAGEIVAETIVHLLTEEEELT